MSLEKRFDDLWAWLVLAIPASMLENRYGPRVIMFVGLLLASSGILLTAFVHGIAPVIFSLGILCGTGLSLVYMGCVTAVPFYFIRYRTLAFGIFSAGGNASSFIFPPVVSSLDQIYAWRGTAIMLSGILLQGLTICMVLRPKERQYISETLDTPAVIEENRVICVTKINEEKPVSVELKQNKGHHTSREVSSRRLGELVKSIAIHSSWSLVFVSDRSLRDYEEKSEQPAPKEEAKDSSCRKRFLKYYHADILQNKTFLCILVCCWFRAFGKLTFLIYVAPFLLEKSFSMTEAAQAYMVMGISQVLTIPLVGAVANRLRYYNCIFWALSMILCGVIILVMTFFAQHKVALMSLLAIYGPAEGVFDALWGAVIADAVGVKRLGNGSGTAQLVTGVAAILGPLLAGKLADITGTFSTTFFFLGTGYLISAVLAFLCAALQSRQGFKVSV